MAMMVFGSTPYESSTFNAVCDIGVWEAADAMMPMIRCSGFKGSLGVEKRHGLLVDEF